MTLSTVFKPIGHGILKHLRAFTFRGNLFCMIALHSFVKIADPSAVSFCFLRDVRKALTRLGALHFLVEAAGCGSMVSRERACQSIGLLGVTRQARRTLVDLGVIPVLVELFRDGDQATKIVAGNSLGVISAHVDYIRPVAQAGAIPLYAELLQGPDHAGKEIAEDVFCILAVAEANAVEIAGHLVRVLRQGDDDAKAAAADVIWDLSGYKHSTSVVRDSGAIPILVELLGSGSEEVKENVSGAFAQLSYDGGDRIALANAGAIPILIDLLHDEIEELRDNAAEALVNFYEDPLYHDRVSDAINVPSFRNMQNRLIHIRASNEHMARSLRRMSVEQLTWNPDLV
ncbi:protein spotted leaf 11-like [Gastrolobium bilobum]|uniref:protein spotted leaf 11-like n=1 Tax=Gastrolobium bilobum TaxID=150636 RepID=UPI002AAF9466|nr:protein spotted leaf 11-like [Gastrolobium bilobum]